MTIRSSLKYKMLHLVFIQAAFFVLLLASLWLINPNWVLIPNNIEDNHSSVMKDFKHHYGMLSTLNMQLANFHQKQNITVDEFDRLSTDLNTHSRAVKTLSQSAQQTFQVDFSVLVSFLFNYQNKIKLLEPATPGFNERLWDIQQYFSRIQSEFFYIIDEVNRVDNQTMTQALKNAQTSLYLWTLVSLMTLALSTFIALNQAAKWKEQIADLLNTIYRLSVGDYQEKNTVKTDDELGYLAKVFSETISAIKKQKEKNNV